MELLKKLNNQAIIKLAHRGTGGQKGWIYSIEGIMATLPASQYKDPFMIVVLSNSNKAVQKKK